MSTPPRRRSDKLSALVQQLAADDDETPPAAREPDSTPPPPATTTAGGARKTTLSLTADTARRLRSWAEHHGTSLGDALITALLDRRDELAGRYAADAERIALGLAPRTTRRDTDRTAVTVWLTPRALAALDDTARRWALTRSALAGELIDLQTAGGAGQ